MALHPVFGLFVAPVAGHIVDRYGVPGTIIGYRREPLPALSAPDIYAPGANPPELIDGCVVALSHAEVARYSREYRRALKNGSLAEATEEDWRDYQESQEGSAQ